MEEKKYIKISLSTFFLLLAIIVIIAMVYYIYIEKTNYNKEIANLEANATNMQSTIVDLQGKIDSIAMDLFEKGSQKIREAHYSDYYHKYDIAEPLTEKTIDGVTYQKANALYHNVEEEYSEIFTGEALKKVLGIRFTEIDGCLYILPGGASGWDITNIKVSRVSESNNEIEYIVTYNNVEVDDSISKEEYSCKMTIKLVDGKYRISTTDYCNLDQED